MATYSDDTKVAIVNGLSALILQAASNQASEESNGGGNADQIDDSIKRQRELVDGLRDIRQRFEDLMLEVHALSSDRPLVHWRRE